MGMCSFLGHFHESSRGIHWSYKFRYGGWLFTRVFAGISICHENDYSLPRSSFLIRSVFYSVARCLAWSVTTPGIFFKVYLCLEWTNRPFLHSYICNIGQFCQWACSSVCSTYRLYECTSCLRNGMEGLRVMHVRAIGRGNTQPLHSLSETLSEVI